jgi:hypothetical protein
MYFIGLYLVSTMYIIGMYFISVYIMSVHLEDVNIDPRAPPARPLEKLRMGPGRGAGLLISGI